MLRVAVAYPWRQITWYAPSDAWPRSGFTNIKTFVFTGFVAETTSFMAECAEDENDNVVKQSHQLKNAVESVAGKVDEL
jgi:hypothetical protein